MMLGGSAQVVVAQQVGRLLMRRFIELLSH
jgi:hypothetical protein